jgi:IS4 transposase
MRLTLTHSRKVRAFVDSGKDDDTVLMTCRHWLSRQVCKQSGVDPDTVLQFRLIRLTLPAGETEVLDTSLLDTEAFPAKLFADLYQRRWGIETYYRRLKQTLTLENVSGRTACAVQQNIHACQLLKNLALLMQARKTYETFHTARIAAR